MRPASPPSRPCSSCGRRDCWHRRSDLGGAWQCCVVSDLDAREGWRVARHDCSALCCGLSVIDDEDDDDIEVMTA